VGVASNYILDVAEKMKKDGIKSVSQKQEQETA